MFVLTKVSVTDRHEMLTDDLASPVSQILEVLTSSAYTGRQYHLLVPFGRHLFAINHTHDQVDHLRLDRSQNVIYRHLWQLVQQAVSRRFIEQDRGAYLINNTFLLCQDSPPQEWFDIRGP